MFKKEFIEKSLKTNLKIIKKTDYSLFVHDQRNKSHKIAINLSIFVLLIEKILLIHHSFSKLCSSTFAIFSDLTID